MPRLTAQQKSLRRVVWHISGTADIGSKRKIRLLWSVNSSKPSEFVTKQCIWSSVFRTLNALFSWTGYTSFVTLKRPYKNDGGRWSCSTCGSATSLGYTWAMIWNYIDGIWRVRVDTQSLRRIAMSKRDLVGQCFFAGLEDSPLGLAPDVMSQNDTNNIMLGLPFCCAVYAFNKVVEHLKKSGEIEIWNALFDPLKRT